MSVAELTDESTYVAEDQGTLRPLLYLAWPVLIEQLLTMLLSFSDTFLVGLYLGKSHLAAMTSLIYVLWVLPNVFSLVSIGATAMVARFVGAEDRDAANRVMHQAFLVGAVLALVTAIAGWLLGENIIRSMQLQGDSVELATQFFRYLLPATPFMMLEMVGIACLRGAGDTRTGLITMILVNVVGASVSWLLMLGAGPLPAMGWRGVAIGTACGHVVGGIVPFVRLLWGNAGLRLHWNELQLDFPLVRRLLRIGIPGGADILFIVTCQLVFLSLVNRLGEAASAAHGLAIRLESLGYLPGVALQVAATTLCGQYLGMGDYRRATRTVATACLAGGGLMTLAGLLMFGNASLLVHLFLGKGQQGVAVLAAPCLQVISLSMLPLAVLMILTGALRGAGDTRWPFVFSVLGFLGVRMPLAYLFAYVFHWGVVGAWYAMGIDLTFRAALVLWRFLNGGWRKVVV